MKEAVGGSEGPAIGPTALDLDRRAIETARSGVAAAMGALAFAAGIAESASLKQDLADAIALLADLLHDTIDPALGEVERRAADQDPAGFSREQRRLRAAYHARIL